MSEQAAVHDHEHAHAADASLTRSAFSATAHCLTGCAIGEVLGMVLATWWGWGNFASISVMEIVDNAFILLVPGAIDAELNDGLFWWRLGVSLIIAFGIALPLNS